MNNPESYSEFSELALRDSTFALNSCLKFFTWDKNIKNYILDIGCGPGNVTKDILLPELPDKVEIYAIDIEKKMVACAQENNQSLKIKYINLNLMDSIANFGKDYFHQIFSFYCLHWIIDQRKAFEIIFDQLKPGGTALITLVGTSPLFEMYEILGKKQKYSQYHKNLEQYISPYHSLNNPSESLENILKTIGFNIHVCESIQRPYAVPDREKLKGHFDSVNPFTGHMPEKIREEYLEEFLDIMKQTQRDKMYYYVMLMTCISKPE